jgi:hypothetical protein
MLPHIARTWLYVLITISQSPHHKQDDLGPNFFFLFILRLFFFL